MRSKRIILVYPKFLNKISFFNIPLAILYLGSFIENKGYQVKIIDCNIEKNYQKLLIDEAKNALAVGISAMTDQIPEVRQLAKILKKDAHLTTPVIFGGVHATLFPKQTAQDPLVDFTVIGEGEYSFWQLLLALEGKKELKKLSGVAFINSQGKFTYKPQTNCFNFENMPLINYRLLNSKLLTYFPKNYVGILTSRGCPHQCSFCINTVIKQNNFWRAWSAKRVVKEIINLKINYGADKFFFWDENFFVSKKRVEEIINQLEQKKLNIKWFANIRADYFRSDFINSDLLKKLRKNGCVRFGIGAESGSQHMLNIYNKKITPAQLITSAKQCHRFKITPTYSFMIGAPGETKLDIKKTISIIGKIIKVCPEAHILGPQLFRPYPGSILYQQCLKAGWQEPKSLADWDEVLLKQFMETDLFKAPWIKNPEFVNIVWFYSLFLVVPTKKLICFFWEYCSLTKEKFIFLFFGTLGMILLSLLGKLRYKTNFYHLAYEVKILKEYRSILSS